MLTFLLSQISRFSNDTAGSVSFEMFMLMAAAMIGTATGADVLASATAGFADVVVLELENTASFADDGMGFMQK